MLRSGVPAIVAPRKRGSVIVRAREHDIGDQDCAILGSSTFPT